MKIIRVKEVAAKMGGSIPLVWRKSADDPDFPKPIKVSPGITGWIEAEVEEYLALCVARYRAAPSKRPSTKIAAKVSADRRENTVGA